ncbi:ANTAR domain-containing protein [Pseudarthrobacter sp. NPDC058329]|uniref:ANTAR domain-containing protein n=1 Tax=Pseudarthrobacter sp. NPDC058329 TaxID=3346448 RepID=UPI0036DC814E
MAVLTLLADTDEHFTTAVITTLTAFCEVAASSYLLAEQHRTLQAEAGQLRQELQSSTSINVACGIIMGQTRCSYQDAARILTEASSQLNVPAGEAAETILKDLPGGAPVPHFKT